MAPYVSIPPVIDFDMFTVRAPLIRYSVNATNDEGSFGILAAIFLLATSPISTLSTQKVYLFAIGKLAPIAFSNC
jgi:hypothetical protein